MDTTPEQPIYCTDCSAVFATNHLSEDDYDVLQELYYYESFSEELKALQKVADFYRRRPDLIDVIRPHVIDVIESEDPEVWEKLGDNLTFDEIDVPKQSFIVEPADAEVVEYLQSNHFSLEARLPYVQEEVIKYQSRVGGCSVVCPVCGDGQLKLDPSKWRNPRVLYD